MLPYLLIFVFFFASYTLYSGPVCVLGVFSGVFLRAILVTSNSVPNVTDGSDVPYDAINATFMIGAVKCTTPRSVCAFGDWITMSRGLPA